MTETDPPGKRAARRGGVQSLQGAASLALTGLGTSEPARKKNLRIRQSKIDEAMAILGTKNETETIEAALDLIVFREELVEGVRAMQGANLTALFDEGA